MACKESEKIGAYLNGMLTKRQRDVFESHLKTCRRCPAELKIFRTLRETLQEKEAKLPKIDVVDKVIRNITQSERKMRPIRIAASPPKRKGRK